MTRCITIYGLLAHTTLYTTLMPFIHC